MLLDKSYFVGPLTLAQLGEKSEVDNLNVFLNRFEPAILQAALGYDFYEAFLMGIDPGSDEAIEDRWLNILNGCKFTDLSGIVRKWPGLAGGDNTLIVNSTVPDPLFITAGVSTGFAIGDNKYVNKSLKNYNITLEFRGIGTKVPGTEWDPIETGGVQLTDENYSTQAGEIWIIHYLSRKIETSSATSVNTNSPLAKLVYAEILRDQTFQRSPAGLVKSQNENSADVNPAFHISEKWNEGCRGFCLLWDMLEVNKDDYPEYDRYQVDLNYFKPLNGFGI